MSDKHGASMDDVATTDLGSIGMGRPWYAPVAGEIDQVRAYLAEIEAAVDQLPELSPEVDGLDVGYDPSWSEVPQ